MLRTKSHGGYGRRRIRHEGPLSLESGIQACSLQALATKLLSIKSL
jgi:hypothetical protein